MLLKKLIYLLLFVFCTWLALATRTHSQWFHSLIATYGGDIIWATMFLFFLRIFFGKVTHWKLAIINFLLGAADETLQLYQVPWIQAIRHTKIGGLLLGFGFLWSDILCYAIGTFIAFVAILLIEKNYQAKFINKV